MICDIYISQYDFNRIIKDSYEITGPSFDEESEFGFYVLINRGTQSRFRVFIISSFTPEVDVLDISQVKNFLEFENPERYSSVMEENNYCKIVKSYSNLEASS